MSTQETQFKVGDKAKIKSTAFQNFSTTLWKWHGATVEIIDNGRTANEFWVRLPGGDKIWIYTHEIEAVKP